MLVDAHLHCTGQESADEVLRTLDWCAGIGGQRDEHQLFRRVEGMFIDALDRLAAQYRASPQGSIDDQRSGSEARQHP